MSNVIQNQAQETIDEINFTVLEQRKAQKQQQARVQDVRTAKNPQKIQKDIVLSANSDQKPIHSKNQEGKPNLSSPRVQYNGFQSAGDEGQQIGLIALIGEVLAKQARSNSHIWSTLWKQAFNSMTTQVKFAPIIGEAIVNAAKAQAAATTADATQAEITGWISIGGFALTCALTGAAIFKEGLNMPKDPNAAAKVSEEDPDEIKASGLNKAPENLENGEDELEEEGNNAVNGQSKANQLKQEGEAAINEGRWKGSVKPFLKAQAAKASYGTKVVGEVVGKGANIAMGIGGLTQGMTALTAQSPQGTAKALQQSAEGKFQALSKESESYQQFFSQVVGRLDDLSRGSSQNIDYALNVLKSAADSLTQTNASMFRG